jgi:tripartite-type tricarboxylate transporter receptor subunit TctC
MRAGLAVFMRIAALAALAIAPALAQNYPAKPIRILIAQAPGSATDVISRRLHQNVNELPILGARLGVRRHESARAGTAGASPLE